MSEITREQFKDESFRDRMKVAWRARSDTVAWKDRQKAGSKRRSGTPEWKESHRAMVTRVTKSAEWRASMAANPCWQRGEDHPSWIGGENRPAQMARTSAAARDWRMAVFARDGFKCVSCGASGRMHGHHIKPWAKNPLLRFDVSNGSTLCVACHRGLHGHYIPA